MRLILNKDYRLRGWKGDPFYLERISTRQLRRLNLSEFSFLIRCDGKTEIAPDRWPRQPDWVFTEDVIAPCKDVDSLLPDQEYKCFPNRRLDYIELSITGRCNLNCKHCFNAKDCNPRTAEPSMEQLFALLERMDECGVGRMRLNGGEPLVRKDLLSFTEEMSHRGIRLYELLTNGTLLTENLLDSLEAQGHKPVWFISFDGLGCHDWLRGVPGSEDKALRAIRLLCGRGYTVYVQQCVWKDSLPSVIPTVQQLEELGVSRYRAVPVEPSLRWLETAPDKTIPTEEWLMFIPGFLEWWYENDIRMDLDIWSFYTHKYGDPRARIVPDLCSVGRDGNSYACETHYNRPFIDADGRLVPCMPMSGAADAYGISWGNVYKGDDLQKVFSGSAFMNLISCTCNDIKARNAKCHDCPWSVHCSVGCRVGALAQGNGLDGIDERICVFYESGCYMKLKEIAGKFGIET